MKIYIESLITKIMFLGREVFTYFTKSPISTVFFTFLLFTFLLNLIKKILIENEKKRETRSQKCKYLNTKDHKQKCEFEQYRDFFLKSGEKCEGCRGKTVMINDDEAEKRVEKESIWKCSIVLLANLTRNLLPYISFFYTLSVTIFENNL